MKALSIGRIEELLFDNILQLDWQHFKSNNNQCNVQENNKTWKKYLHYCLKEEEEEKISESNCTLTL